MAGSSTVRRMDGQRGGFLPARRPAGGRLARASWVLLLVLAIEVGAWAGVGALFEDGLDPAIPSELRTAAAPFIGDRGEYSLSSLGDPSKAGSERPFVQFQWLSAQPMRDSLGVAHAANRLWVSFTAPSPFDPEGGEDRTTPLDLTFFYAEAGRAFARTQRNATTEVSSSGWPLAGGASTDAKESSRTLFLDAEGSSTLEPCCGLRNRLQGRAAPSAPDGPLALFLDPSLGPRSFQAVQVDVVAGNASVRWEAGHPGPIVRTWTTAAVPYPLRIEVERPDERGAFDVVRLSRFERGQAPLAWEPERSGPAAPPLDRRPNRPWGPDDEGVEHPWPLSAAYQYALTDHTYPDTPLPELRQFLAAHPRAVTQFAKYWETARAPAGRDFGWHIVVGDDDAWFRFASVRETYPVSLPTVAGRPADELGPRPQTREAYVDHRPWNERLVPPDRAPASIPSVASLLSRWELHRAPPDAALVGNFWSYALRCVDDACTRAEAVMTAGALLPFADAVQDRTTEPTAPTETGVIASGVTWAGGEAVRETRGRTHRETTTILGAPPTASDGPPSASARPAAVSQSMAPFSPVALAAAGITAVAAAALYAFGPTLRVFWSLPFFSRLEPETGHAHPARRLLRDEIEREPGLHFHALVRRTGLSRGATIHHLRKLVEFRSVCAVDGNGYLCYFPVGRLDHRLMAALPFLKSQGARRILAAIAARPGTSGRLLAQAVALDPGTVNVHLRRLDQVGLVAIDRSRKELRPALTALGRSALERLPPPSADQ